MTITEPWGYQATWDLDMPLGMTPESSKGDKVIVSGNLE